MMKLSMLLIVVQLAIISISLEAVPLSGNESPTLDPHEGEMHPPKLQGSLGQRLMGRVDHIRHNPTVLGMTERVKPMIAKGKASLSAIKARAAAKRSAKHEHHPSGVMESPGYPPEPIEPMAQVHLEPTRSDPMMEESTIHERTISSHNSQHHHFASNDGPGMHHHNQFHNEHDHDNLEDFDLTDEIEDELEDGVDAHQFHEHQSHNWSLRVGFIYITLIQNHYN